MSRAPRNAVAGMCHHVMARGNGGRSVFDDDEDRLEFLGRLGRISARCRWACLAYCLMSTHFHLAISTSEANLSGGMRDLLSSYARWRNGRRGDGGHLFRERFRSVDVTTDRQLLAVLRYVALNPVEAGLVTTPGHWRWSSFAAVTGRVSAPDFLAVDEVLSLFGSERRGAAEAFEAFVLGGQIEIRPEVELGAIASAKRASIPSIEEILRMHGPLEGPAVCIDLGHSRTAVGAALGVSPWSVTRRIRRARGVEESARR